MKTRASLVPGVLVVLGLVVVGVLGAGATRSAAYHIERSTLIAAAPEQVFAIVSNLHRYPEWQPWARLDPNLHTEIIEGAEPGRGTHYAWSGNDDVGTGSLDLTTTQPERVDADLIFVRPYPSRSKVYWLLAREGDQTRVTWAMDGRNAGLIAKTMSMFVDLDKMLGKDFAIGLDRLKHVVERH